MAENIYKNIGQNRNRTILLVLLMPLFLIAIIYGLFYAYGLLMEGNTVVQQQYYKDIKNLLPSICGGAITIVTIWLFISYFSGSKMILNAAHAKSLTKSDNPVIYNLVQNLAITAGLPMPKIYVIEDESLNAFATGRNPENASITLTTGIIRILNKQELEAVIAHEMSHIGNRDIRLMLLMVAGIGCCTFFGHVLIRSGRGGRDGAPIMLLGAALLLFGLLLAPLLRLAVSRQREYQADATGVLLTRNPLALASALEKISQDARVEILDSQQSVSAMCIANPLKKTKSLFGSLSGITATHPPIDERVRRLKAMGR